MIGLSGISALLDTHYVALLPVPKPLRQLKDSFSHACKTRRRVTRSQNNCKEYFINPQDEILLSLLYPIISNWKVDTLSRKFCFKLKLDSKMFGNIPNIFFQTLEALFLQQ